MDFKLAEKERQRILTFIENHLLFVENAFMFNKFRDAIKYDSIPDLPIITETQKDFINTNLGPYIYMVNWTPVGFRYMVINQLDECENFTNEASLENWYKIHKDSFYDKDKKHLYTYEELMQIRPFTLLFMNTGIGTQVRIVCNATNESKNVTDYNIW